MSSLAQDLRHAIRRLRTSPLFTLIAALTIALGIGATTTVFSVVNAVLLRAPPGIRDSREIVRIHRIAEDGSSYNAFSYPNYLDYRDGTAELADLEAATLLPIVLNGTESSRVLFGLAVSEGFFRMMGVHPELGRLFLPEEDRTAGTDLVALLSYDTWVESFGRDPAIVGRTVTLSRRSFTVVGVTQEGFRGPNSMAAVGIWLPIHAAPAIDEQFDMASRASTWVDIFGRRAPGVSEAQLSTALDVISANLRAAYPTGNPDHGVDVQRYAPISRQAFGPALAVSAFLLAATGTLLLVACLNVGGMLLARATGRGKEMALRLALGARRLRLIRQLLTESAVLFGLGALGGALITVCVTRLLAGYRLPVELPIALDFAPDARVFVFCLSIALLAGMVFGLAPALQLSRTSLHATLKEEHGTGSAGRARLRNAFVVTQVAGSVVLLIGAGLFARGLARVNAIDIGFQPDGVHAVDTELDAYGYDVPRAVGFYNELLDRASRLPGVESAALIDVPPLVLGGRETTYTVPGGEPVVAEELPTTDLARVTPGYFETFRIPILEGRSFAESDREDAGAVAIVNETFARINWPGMSPLGRRVGLGELEGAEVEVVGLARDAKYRSVAEESRPMVYVAYRQNPTAAMVLLARVGGDAGDVPRALHQTVRDIDIGVHAAANVPYRDLMKIALLPGRAGALFFSVIGAVGMALASLGLYGVLAYMVAQRSREIGIRIALGAEPRRVCGLVLRHAARLAGGGLALGLAAAVLVMRGLEKVLYGVSPTDPIAFGGIAALFMAVALGAALIPAVRATRTDPVRVLQAE